MSIMNRINQAQGRSDGYSQQAANDACKFQADVETGKLGTVNYDALRYTLKLARERSMSYNELVSTYKTKN